MEQLLWHTNILIPSVVTTFFLLAFIAVQTAHDMEYPYVLTMSSPKILSTLSLLVRLECWRNTFDAAPALPSLSQNTDVLSAPVLATSSDHRTVRMLWEN